MKGIEAEFIGKGQMIKNLAQFVKDFRFLSTKINEKLIIEWRK
jgi:hypothetical protein